MMSELTSNSETLLLKPIPEVPPVAGWKEIPIDEPKTTEPLVPLGPFSNFDKIFSSSIYFGEQGNSPYGNGQLEGSLLTVFVRRGVADMLKRAQANLPRGLHLIVFDAYRPLQVQKSLYDTYYNELKNQHPEWTEDQLSAETQKYVSLPRSPRLDPQTTFVSPHNTGGAVDLAIFQLPEEIEQELRSIEKRLEKFHRGDIVGWRDVYKLEMQRVGLVNRHARLLNFGTKFDYGGEQAALNYYEILERQRPLTGEEKEAQKNRRVLYNVMINSGFEPYADEWWHFNSPKSQMGAKTAGLKTAEYGPTELSKKSQGFETMRKVHRLGSIRISKDQFEFQTVYPADLSIVAIGGVNETGDLRITSLPKAEIIKPQEKAA